MILDIDLDGHEHSHNERYIHGLGLSEQNKDSVD